MGDLLLCGLVLNIACLLLAGAACAWKMLACENVHSLVKYTGWLKINPLQSNPATMKWFESQKLFHNSRTLFSVTFPGVVLQT